MESTRLYHPDAPTPDLHAERTEGDLVGRYRTLLAGDDPDWAADYRDLRLAGRGGQGVVFSARREGADGFLLPIALKVFSPEPYRTPEAYAEDMRRVAAVASRVAAVQQENLITVHGFFTHAGLRVMRMELVDGLDLRQVLSPGTLQQTRERLAPDQLRAVEEVILALGPVQPRLKPGVAIHVLRDCLAALAALHRDGLTHGDLKPSNIMLKRTGLAKVVDIGSAADLRSAAGRRAWSPLYAAPEVLDGSPGTPQSDLASLGYVLIEMLAGRPPFEEARGCELMEAKLAFEGRLAELMPAEVARCELLIGLCRRLVSADPGRRFPDAGAADLGRGGAAAFHRQLMQGNLDSAYGNDVRLWLTALDQRRESTLR